MGVTFRDAVTDITGHCGLGAWTLVDLSGYGVPANADMAFIRLTGGLAPADGIQFRYPGGTQASVLTDMSTVAHYWAYAPILNQQIEVFRESGSIAVFLDGWAYGGDWHGLVNPIDLTPGLVVDIWNLIDSSAYAPNAKAIIFEYDGPWFWAVRKFGSAWPSGQQGDYHHGWGICGCDDQQRWQIYPTSFGGALKQDIEVIGYVTGDECEFLTDWQDISLGATGYHEIDVAAYFTKPWDMSIVRVIAALSQKTYDARPIGSARNWQRAHSNRKWFVVKNTRGSLKFEGYINDLITDFYLVGGYGFTPASRTQGQVIG